MSKKPSIGEAAGPPLLLPESLWDASRTMKLLGVSRSKLYYLMTQEDLPFIKFNRMLRFDPNDVASWLVKHKSSA